MAPRRARWRGDQVGEQAPELGRALHSWTVLGDPKGQPRPRACAVRIGGKVTARVYNPDVAERWKLQVAHALGPPSRCIEGPVAIRVDLFFGRPKRLMTRQLMGSMVRHTVRPDSDNVAKAVLDAMTDLGWWRDDSQVCELLVTKWYAAAGESPGARIMLEELPQ